MNTWDDVREGNCWTDYNGSDLDNGGVGDTPYTIDANNADRCPLMYISWNPCDISHDLKVDLRDLGMIEESACR